MAEKLTILWNCTILAFLIVLCWFLSGKPAYHPYLFLTQFRCMGVVQAIKNDILVSLTHCFDRIYAKRNKQKQNKIIISNRTDDNYSYSIQNAACDIESDIETRLLPVITE